MTILRSNQTNGTFVGLTKEQDTGDPDWLSYTPSFKGTSEKYTIDGTSTSTELVTSAGAIPVEGQNIIVKVGTDSTVIKGTVGAVTNNSGTYTADISSLNLSGVPSVVCKDNLPRMFTSFEQQPPRCLCLNSFIAINSASTTNITGEYTGGLAFEAGDDVIPYPSGFGTSIDNASWDSVSFDALALDSDPWKIQFNNNGTRLFMLGIGSDNLYQLDLTTPYDISSSSMSYSGVSYNVNDVMFIQGGFRFNDDGTKLFMVGRAGADQVTQYNLSTGFDLSTMSYSGISFEITEGFNSPKCLAFSDDGLKLIIVRSGRLYPYSMVTPYDITTLTYDGASFDAGAQDDPIDIAFNADGSRLFTAGSGGRYAYQYSLDTPYELATITYGGIRYDFGPESFDSRGITFTPDGTKMYMVTDFSNNTNANDDTIYQYSINGSINSTEANPGTAVTISNVTESGVSNEPVISRAVYDNVNFDPSTDPLDFQFNDDGTELFILAGSLEIIRRYTLPTAYDITGAVDSGDVLILNIDFAYSFKFSNDGTKIFGLSRSTRLITEWVLPGGAFTITGGRTDSGTFSVGNEETEPQGFTFNGDGTKMYVVGNNTNTVYQYTLSTAFEITSTTYDSISLNVEFVGSPEGLTFNSDGSRMYVIGDTNNSVYRFDLSTPYDLSTASYANERFSVRLQGDRTRKVQFSPDGSKMYMLDLSNGLFQYSVPELPVRSVDVDFADAGFVPELIAVPDRSIEHTAIDTQAWVDEQVETIFALVENPTARALQYKFVMPQNSEVTEVKYVLDNDIS